MRLSPNGRRRPAVQITSGRAARLHRLVMLLAQRPRTRDEILRELVIGLRTFYRELELMARCGIKVRHKDRAYLLLTTAEQAKGRLPFPDPQLSFAEMADLSRTPGAAGRRLADMLARVLRQPAPTPGGSKAAPTRPGP
jgi:predicted DNA-binding transcriptional regulator YafY